MAIKIYDVLGKDVLTLVGKNELPGKHSINFNASNLSSGIYFYQLKAVPTNNQIGNFIQTRKMVLLR